MSLWDSLKKYITGKPENSKTIAISSNGISPFFAQFGDNILAADTVVQAIDTIVTEMRKLNPRHYRRDGSGVKVVNDNIQMILKYPNPLMTKGDFIEKIMWNYYLNNNAFIYKCYALMKGKPKLVGLYPLQPMQVDFLEDADGKYYVKLYFANGYEPILPYNRIIHIRRSYYQNDFMGGNESGQPNNEPLLETLRLNKVLLDGIAKALKASYAVNGVLKYNTMLDDGSMEREINNFNERIVNSESGIIGLDLKNELTQLRRDIKIVDNDTLKFFDDKILRNYGVPVEVLRGKYTMEDYQAFYQRAIEDKVITVSDAFTRGLFSSAQLAKGHEIYYCTKELEFFSVNQKIEMINLLAPTGTLFENEKRVAIGYDPSEELDGLRLQSLNYVDAKHALDYQMKGKMEK